MNYKDLKPNFIALAIRSQLYDCGQTKKASIHTKLVEFFIQDLSKIAEIPDRNAIATESNLSLAVFENILCTLGLDYSSYVLKRNLVDTKLLKIRNYVAHGKRIDIDKDDFLNLHAEIMLMIDSFKEQIVNAAKNQEFLS